MPWRRAAPRSPWRRGMLRVVQAAPRLPRTGAAGAAGPGRRSPAGRGHGAGPGCGRLKGAFVAVPAFPGPEVRAGLEGAYCRRAGPGRAGRIPAPPPHAGPPPGPGSPGTGPRTPAPAVPPLPGAALLHGEPGGTGARRDAATSPAAGADGSGLRPLRPSSAPPEPPRCPPRLVGPPPPLCPCRALFSAAWELHASCPALAGAEPPTVPLWDVRLVLVGCTPPGSAPCPPPVGLINHSHGQGEGDTRHRPVPFPPDCPGSTAGPRGTLTFNLHHFGGGQLSCAPLQAGGGGSICPPSQQPLRDGPFQTPTAPQCPSVRLRTGLPR